MRAVIFDLDGTLIDSKIDFKKMKSEIIGFLQKIGVAPKLLNDSMLNFEIIKIAVNNLHTKNFSEEEIQRILAKVTDIMNRIELESLDEATLITGVPKTLKTLKEKNLKIGIITNSCRRYAETILAKFGIDKYVDAIAARDDVSEPKPNPEHALFLLRLLDTSVKESLLLGDHWLDAECARAAGLKFVLLRNRRQNSGPSFKYNCQIIDNIKDIIDLVKNESKIE